MELSTQKKRRETILHSLGFLLCSTALVMQYYIAYTKSEGAIFGTLLKLSTFFTIVSNTMLWLTHSTQLFAPKAALARFFAKNTSATAIVTYITFVVIVYHLLLQKSWNPQGLQWYVGELLHRINPLIFLIYWIFFVPKNGLSFKQLPYWLIVPTVYFFYVMSLGLFGMRYPYPFLDVNKLGYVTVLLTGVVLLLTLSGIASVYIFAAKKTKQG